MSQHVVLYYPSTMDLVIEFGPGGALRQQRVVHVSLDYGGLRGLRRHQGWGIIGFRVQYSRTGVCPCIDMICIFCAQLPAVAADAQP